MEITTRHIKIFLLRWFCMVFMSMSTVHLSAQAIRGYSIKDGKMYIVLDRKIADKELKEFIEKYQLEGIGLWQLVKTDKHDSLEKEGWQVVAHDKTGFVISKRLESAESFEYSPDKITWHLDKNDFSSRFPSVSNKWVYGLNWFRNKQAFPAINDLGVQFFLRGYKNAHEVYLSGSFNAWSPTALPMKFVDSGWMAYVKMPAGKYWYKFIADGKWMVDYDNELRENDGMGNMNSVYYRTNQLFTLNGFTNAKNVFLAGSFNNWKPKDLRMHKTADGWELPLYLANGTHQYKFVVDGKWYADDKNNEKLPDGNGAFNSVISIGKPYTFSLRGYENAKQVMLAGSFNNWRDFELPMKRTATGWELPYVIGAGNYEYKFVVDGKWIPDPGNPMTPSKDGNSFLIIEPNYTFRLKGNSGAKKVYLAGDFNSWNPEAYPMKLEGDEWTFQLHLPPGKTRYKFIVDGKWILDPANKLWEQNEYKTGNSVLWIENKY